MKDISHSRQVDRRDTMTLAPRDLGTEQVASGPFRPLAQELSRSECGGRWSPPRAAACRNSGQDPLCRQSRLEAARCSFFGLSTHDASKPSYQKAASDMDHCSRFWSASFDRIMGVAALSGLL